MDITFEDSKEKAAGDNLGDILVKRNKRPVGKIVYDDDDESCEGWAFWMMIEDSGGHRNTFLRGYAHWNESGIKADVEKHLLAGTFDR